MTYKLSVMMSSQPYRRAECHDRYSLSAARMRIASETQIQAFRAGSAEISQPSHASPCREAKFRESLDAEHL
jgi:hypothetical protein